MASAEGVSMFTPPAGRRGSTDVGGAEVAEAVALVVFGAGLPLWLLEPVTLGLWVTFELLEPLRRQMLRSGGA